MTIMKETRASASFIAIQRKPDDAFVSKRLLDATMTPLLRSLINQKIDHSFGTLITGWVREIDGRIRHYEKKRTAETTHVPSYVEPLLAYLETAKKFVSERKYVEFYEYRAWLLERAEKGMAEPLKKELPMTVGLIQGHIEIAYLGTGAD